MPNPAFPFAPGLTIGNTPQVTTVNAGDLQWVWQGGILVAAQVQNVIAAKLPSGQFTLATNATSTAVTVSGVRTTSIVKWWPAANSNLVLALAAANMLPFMAISPLPSANTVTFVHSSTTQTLTYNFEVTI